MAFPREALLRSGDPEADRRALAQVAREEAVVVVVVGLPLSLDGSVGRAAGEARREADGLRELLSPEGIGVELFDERLTTVSAAAALAQAGKRGPARRAAVDGAAAAILLEAWLHTH